MALLQLAENGMYLAEDNGMKTAETNTVGSNYLFIPSGLFGMDKDTYVKSDFFDSLSNDEFNVVMQTIAPYQQQGLSAIGIAAIASFAGPAIKKAIARRQEKVAAGTAKPIFKPGGKLANLGAKIKGGIQKFANVPAAETKSVVDNTTPVSGSLDIGGTSVDFSTAQPAPTNFLTKYKTPLIIGGAVIGGLLLFKVLKKK